MVQRLLAVSVVSVPITLTHAVEDLSVGVHERFGVPLLLAAFAISLDYAAQVLGAALSARGERAGHALNLVVALLWLVGAVLDHLGEVIGVPTEQYRAGAVSKLLEAGIMVLSAAWAWLALEALREPQRAR